MGRLNKNFYHPSIKQNKASIFTKLLIMPIILSLIGLFFIFEASSIKSFQEFNDSFYFFKLQGLWISLGVFVMLFFLQFDYHRLYYFSFYLMFFNIILLVLVLIPTIGHSAGGARRWFDLGFFNFQPTELAKFSTILYLCSWFLRRERKRFFAFLILLSWIILLIILQPDMGTAFLIFLIAVLIYFYAGIELHYLIFLLPFSLLSFFLLIKISPYRLTRFLAFLNPNQDPLGISYHINQIFISLGNGGLFGLGLGASRQKYLFLPEAHTDSIFAIIAEEFGFIGALIVIFLYFYFLQLLYIAAKEAKDRFAYLLASSIFSLFALQILINLGGITNLIPLTGVPLPFISYGGSNILISFALVGICLNIIRKNKN